MTVHRSQGAKRGGGKRKQTRQPTRRRSTSTSDENSSDGGSITRCICGETHGLGLMVQCDKCEVWQHCKCMGLEQPDIPDQYYCEQCKPENHKSTKLTNGRLKRQYHSAKSQQVQQQAPPPKKRMTLNSREASMSLEDVLAARSALEMYEHEEQHKSPTIQTLKLQDEVIEEMSEPPSSTVSSVGHEETIMKELTPEIVSSPLPPAPVPTPIKKAAVKRKPKSTTETVKRNNINRKKPRSRTSTPQPLDDGDDLADSDFNTPQQQQQQQDISTMIFEYFSPRAREASPPAKCKQLQSKMTLSEMNKRANHILEYISSIQIEMASSSSPLTSNSSKEKSINDIPEEDDDNDSLSSASTIPLNHSDDEDSYAHIDKEKQSSLEIMDMLTRKLIKFQKKFGRRHSDNNNGMDLLENEGRITRSREASGYRSNNNMMAH